MEDNELPEDCAVVFDLDGTVWDVGHRLDWTNPGTMPAYCRAKPRVVERLQFLHAHGVRLAALTARRKDLHQAVTYSQIRQVLGDAIADTIPVLLNPATEHTGMGVVLHKMAGLTDLKRMGWKIAAYVGDEDLDRTAATASGIRFMHVDDFAAGQLLRFDGETLRTVA